MGRFVKLKLDKDINIEEFLDFLNFHQFGFETEEEEVFNFDKMSNEQELNFLIPEEKIEEFKVMTLIYKDLQESKLSRNLNIPIENSAIDYEQTRRINVVELTNMEEERKRQDEEIFRKGNTGSNSMEDSFYGNKSKKKEKRISDAYLENEILSEDDKGVKKKKPQSKGTIFIKDILKIIGLLIIILILAGVFLLIR